MDLKSITIRDFRSISGKITVPLDAPIVLIHGVNGAGKTSVLTALELALTGAAASLQSQSLPDREAGHLVHRGASEAEITVAVESEGGAQTSTVTVGADGTVRGAPALDAYDARTFAERCYLAQSRVSRLLEIYQDKITTESPLTRFVKDLLGLDRVDAIIDGLHSAGHQARIRNAVPELRVVESELKRMRDLADSSTEALAATRSEIASLVAEIERVTSAASDLANLVGFASEASPESRNERQVVLRAIVQELEALALRLDQLPAREDSLGERLTGEASAARQVLDAWEAGSGLLFRAVAESVGVQSGVTLNSVVDVETTYRATVELVRRQIERTAESLRADESATERVRGLNAELAKVRERAVRLADQAATLSEDAPGVALALSAIVPFISGDVCPVCLRDHSEVSDISLTDSVSARISGLNQEAARLQSIAESLRESEAQEREILKALDVESARLLEPDDRLALRRDHQEAVEWQQKLDRIELEVGAASEAQLQWLRVQSELARFRNEHSASTDIRVALSGVAARLGEEVPRESDSLRSLIGRYLERARAESTTMSALAAYDEELIGAAERLKVLRERERAAGTELRGIRDRVSELEAALDRLESVKTAAKALARRAEEVRSRAVAGVFTSELNGLWRDLFVRLVPAEPFVPQFEVDADSPGASAVELRTLHRDGGRGGEPGMVLSAGNLNTSAVTLFFALHLVANVKMPWLILDDPVQSMDEVHIAQFAALLRTLAKEHGKKVIVAVHERSLFDYLALELSPSYEGDRLVTVELSRLDNARTLVDPEFVPWSPDPAFEDLVPSFDEGA